jgi:hypothetical protein
MSDRPEDIVTFFGQQMRRDYAEDLQAAQDETHLVCDGEVYPKVAYGDETFRRPIEADHKPCRHCGTIKGKSHSHACDYEQCPKCHHQLMSCDCEFVGHEWRTEEA